MRGTLNLREFLLAVFRLKFEPNKYYECLLCNVNTQLHCIAKYVYVHIVKIHAIFHLICRMLSLVYLVYILHIFNFNSQNSWAGSLLYVMDGCFIYSRIYMVSIDSIWYWYWWNGKWLIWIHGINNSEQTTTFMTYINLSICICYILLSSTQISSLASSLDVRRNVLVKLPGIQWKWVSIITMQTYLSGICCLKFNPVLRRYRKF